MARIRTRLVLSNTSINIGTSTPTVVLDKWLYTNCTASSELASTPVTVMVKVIKTAVITSCTSFYSALSKKGKVVSSSLSETLVLLGTIGVNQCSFPLWAPDIGDYEETKLIGKLSSIQ